MERTIIRAAIFVILASAQANIAWSQNDSASQYLFEYASTLYKRGSIKDARHELKKALMVNPNNLEAIELLRKISPGVELRVNGPDNVCAGQYVTFEAGISNAYEDDKFVYAWDFGDHSYAKGAQAIHAYALPGEYTVTLTASEDSATPLGRSTDTVPISVGALPVAIMDIRVQK